LNQLRNNGGNLGKAIYRFIRYTDVTSNQNFANFVGGLPETILNALSFPVDGILNGFDCVSVNCEGNLFPKSKFKFKYDRIIDNNYQMSKI